MGFGYCSVGEWVSCRKLYSSGDSKKCITGLYSGGDCVEYNIQTCFSSDSMKSITGLYSGGDLTARITGTHSCDPP